MEGGLVVPETTGADHGMPNKRSGSSRTLEQGQAGESEGPAQVVCAIGGCLDQRFKRACSPKIAGPLLPAIVHALHVTAVYARCPRDEHFRITYLILPIPKLEE
jgi:hypothetical protein